MNIRRNEFEISIVIPIQLSWVIIYSIGWSNIKKWGWIDKVSNRGSWEVFDGFVYIVEVKYEQSIFCFLMNVTRIMFEISTVIPIQLSQVVIYAFGWSNNKKWIWIDIAHRERFLMSLYKVVEVKYERSIFCLSMNIIIIKFEILTMILIQLSQVVIYSFSWSKKWILIDKVANRGCWEIFDEFIQGCRSKIRIMHLLLLSMNIKRIDFEISIAIPIQLSQAVNY